MAQEPSSRDLLEAVKQQESGGRRYKADGKTLLEGPPTKYGTAKGEMQVLDMTNRDPGFGVRPAKDDSPDERARVGRDYLAAMKKRYGDTETGLIAYNWGPGNTDKWIKKGADPAKLPKETQNYVAKIMASLGGPDVSRETTAVAAAPKKAAPKPVVVAAAKPGVAGTTTKKPAPVAAAPAAAPVTVASMDSRLADLGPSYQAALALSFLADTDEKEDRDIDREPGVAEKYLAEMEAAPRPAALSEFIDVKIRSPFAEAEQPEQPVGMAEGGEVEDPQMMANKTTELQGYKTKQPDGTNELWGPDVPVSRSAKELKAYTEALNPAVKTFTGGLGMGTRGYIYPDQPDIINLNTALTPGEREITTLHELEHSMDARGGDIYGRPTFAKMGGMDNNYRAYSLMGDDWTPITATVKNMVDNREKLEKFFGRPLDNSYFRKDSYDNLKKVGKTKALFSEQIASLAALEQTTGKFLTQDPEMRELFPNTRMMAVYDALTGPRQTRMDARDLPPHTPVPSYTYEQNPTLRFIKKSLTGENEYGTSYRPFPIKRAKGSPEEGEVGYFQDPFGVPDSGPVTSDTLSKGKEFSAADALRALKEVGAGTVSNAESLVRGAVAQVPGLVGDVESLGRKGINFSFGPGGVKVNEKTLAPTSEEIRARVPRITPARPESLGMESLGEVMAPSFGKGAGTAVTKGKKAAEMLAKDFQAYNQALGPAGVSYAVKPKGGAFTGTREYEYTPSGSIGQETFRDSVTSIIKKGDLMPELRPELKIPIESRNALNSWVEDRIGNYIRRDMATPNDPFVKAVDEGKKLHLLEGLGDIKPMSDLAKRRHKQGFPAWGSAKTPLGRKLEKQIDSSMWSEDIGDVDNYQIYPKMESLKDTNPNMQIYTPGSRIADRMQFPKMIEGMEDMLTERRYTAYGDTSTPIPQEYQLTPEKLQGLSPVDASEKVALFNQWRDKERQVQAAQYLDKYGNVYKKYDNGRKWIAMDDLAVEPKQAELAQQAGCLGGWCTKYTDQAMINGSGDNRLHILFDEKAVPRIQLTVTKSPPQAGDFIAQMDEYQVNNFQNKYGNTRYLIPSQVYDTPEYQAWARTQDIPERITQIKGQFDKIKIADDSNTSRYLKEVQDFVKSKDWAKVDNLDGINMIDLDDSLPTISRGLNLEQTNQLSDFMKSLNGGSRFADKYEGKNIVREAAMRVFQPSTPPGRAMGGMVQGYAKGGIADLPKDYDEDDPTTLKPFLPTTTPTANTTGIATIVPNAGNPNAAAAQAASFAKLTPVQLAQHKVQLAMINDAKPVALQIALALKDAVQNAINNSTSTSSGGVSSTSGSPMGGIASKGTVGQANAAVAAANAALGNAIGGGSGGGTSGGTSGSGMGGMGTGAAGAAASAAATGRADGGMIERQFIDNRRYM